MNNNTVLGVIVGLVLGFVLGWMGGLHYERKQYDYHLRGPDWEIRGRGVDPHDQQGGTKLRIGPLFDLDTNPERN